jgi:hypothetical protein
VSVQNGTPVSIRHFTDPGCPFAFSAERQRLRLAWLHGDQIDWTTHLVVLREESPPEDWPTAGRVDLPGFRPIEAYEAALANLAPELTRRPDPEDVETVLEWAGMPLATAEVAAVCDRDVPDVRAELARAAARFEPVGGDGYWSLA